MDLNKILKKIRNCDDRSSFFHVYLFLIKNKCIGIRRKLSKNAGLCYEMNLLEEDGDRRDFLLIMQNKVIKKRRIHIHECG
jgi:hypothetical protein